jgi:hypothetical protein
MLDARRWLIGVVFVGLAAAATSSGCAAGSVEIGNGGSDPVTNVASTGGSGGAGGGTGGSPSLCAMDCSSIATPQCLQSVCNDGTYQGVVGECVIVPSEEGTACDDSVFCTVEDTCDGTGQCIGGPENDCGMTPEPCMEVDCVEASMSCTQIASMNGAPCQIPTDLCIKGSTCSNGNCIGGTPDDCFFFPVPDDCHIAACNPATGNCEAQVGNEGDPCVDSMDLCTVNKTCMTGMCQGGTPKDCNALTLGCVLGVCDTATGMCVAQNLMNGDPCNDLNACTTGETCQTGMCANGTPITQCSNGDGCCPPSCTISNDTDCSTSCLGILQSNPSAPDGPYQIFEGMTMVNVYCDMTHGGDTYRELAFGNHLGTYPGYSLVSVADLQDSVIQQAFIYLYNQQGSALNNLDTSWTTGNCCIKLAEHVNLNNFLQLGSSYIYPASMANQADCNSMYPNPQYRFYLTTANQVSPNPMLSNYFLVNPAGTTSICSNSLNPGFFWKKF